MARGCSTHDGGASEQRPPSSSSTPTGTCASPPTSGSATSRPRCGTAGSGCAGTRRPASTSAWSRTAWRPNAVSSASATRARASRLRPRPPLRGLNPAGFDAHERVKVLDSEGIDISVMYPGLGLKLGGIHDPELAVRVVRGLQRLGRRVVLGRTRPPQGSRRAPDAGSRRSRGREAHRIRDRGLVGGVRPTERVQRPAVPRSAYTPVWEALEETGLPLGLHITGLADMPGAARGDAPPHGAGNASRDDPGDRPDDDAVEPRRTAACSSATPGSRSRCSRAAAAGSRTGWTGSTSSRRATGGRRHR